MLLSKAAESSRTTQLSTVSLVVAWKLGIDVSISLCSSADEDVIFCRGLAAGAEPVWAVTQLVPGVRCHALEGTSPYPSDWGMCWWCVALW